MLWNEAASGRPFAFAIPKRSRINPIMRGVFLGSLVFVALAAGSSALAFEAGSAADTASSAPSSKYPASPKSKKRPVPLAAAFEATRTTELPAASIQPRQSPPTQPSWSGTYIGVGAGFGVAR
jgi:hypothetical protein